MLSRGNWMGPLKQDGALGRCVRAGFAGRLRRCSGWAARTGPRGASIPALPNQAWLNDAFLFARDGAALVSGGWSPLVRAPRARTAGPRFWPAGWRSSTPSSSRSWRSTWSWRSIRTGSARCSAATSSSRPVRRDRRPGVHRRSRGRRRTRPAARSRQTGGGVQHHDDVPDVFPTAAHLVRESPNESRFVVPRMSFRTVGGQSAWLLAVRLPRPAGSCCYRRAEADAVVPGRGDAADSGRAMGGTLVAGGADLGRGPLPERGGCLASCAAFVGALGWGV